MRFHFCENTHVLCLVAHPCLTLCDPWTVTCQGPVHGDSPGKNTGVGCHALLQGIFPTQGLNPGLPHCRQILYCLSHQGRIFRRPCNGKDHIAMSQAQVCSPTPGPIGPRILEWVAYPFSRGSSPLKNQPRVSCIAGGFFTS